MQVYKASWCVFFARGRCTRGSNCSFAHTSDELRQLPDLRKTKLCNAFMNGECKNEKCNYAHGVQELRDFPGKKGLCRLFREGKCVHGLRCKYAHTLNELEVGYVFPDDIMEKHNASSSSRSCLPTVSKEFCKSVKYSIMDDGGVGTISSKSHLFHPGSFEFDKTIKNLPNSLSSLATTAPSVESMSQRSSDIFRDIVALKDENALPSFKEHDDTNSTDNFSWIRKQRGDKNGNPMHSLLTSHQNYDVFSMKRSSEAPSHVCQTKEGIETTYAPEAMLSNGLWDALIRQSDNNPFTSRVSIPHEKMDLAGDMTSTSDQGALLEAIVTNCSAENIMNAGSTSKRSTFDHFLRELEKSTDHLKSVKYCAINQEDVTCERTKHQNFVELQNDIHHALLSSTKRELFGGMETKIRRSGDQTSTRKQPTDLFDCFASSPRSHSDLPSSDLLCKEDSNTSKDSENDDLLQYFESIANNSVQKTIPLQKITRDLEERLSPIRGRRTSAKTTSQKLHAEFISAQNSRCQEEIYQALKTLTETDPAFSNAEDSVSCKFSDGIAGFTRNLDATKHREEFSSEDLNREVADSLKTDDDEEAKYSPLHRTRQHEDQASKESLQTAIFAVKDIIDLNLKEKKFIEIQNAKDNTSGERQWVDTESV